jgi:hypothetical protein
MNLDIETTVRVIFIMLLIVGAALLLIAIRAFREASRLRFFLKKRALLGRAWQFVFFALIVTAAAFLINGYAEPVTYQFFQPSATPTLTATVTPTSTITQTPTITQTATITPTLEFTTTPEMPVIISQDFTSQVTPNPNAVFSNLSFSRRLTGEYLPIDPAVTFSNPIDALYASFSYDSMSVGTQWTALWFRDGELIHYESKPWNGASGGYGYSDCLIPTENWLPGNYEVQMFIGEQWKASGTFAVTGEPPTPTSTPTLTQTLTSTAEPTLTLTPTLTITPTLTGTLAPSATLEPTQTRTSTPLPSQTLAPTGTALPTNTGVPTSTPTETPIPAATRNSTFYR